MTGPITFEFFAALVSTILVIAAVWWKIEGRIRGVEDKNEAQFNRNRDDHTALRAEMLRDYVSIQHSEKLESRLLLAIDRLIEEVKALRASLFEVKYQHKDKD